MDHSTPLGRMNLPYNTVPKTPSKGLKPDAPRLAVNDATTDFSIICENGPLRVHKAVLVSKSPYFKRMLRFGGKVDTLQRLIVVLANSRKGSPERETRDEGC